MNTFQKQLVNIALKKWRQDREWNAINNAKKAIWNSNLKDVIGIWDATIAKLSEVGIKTQEQLKELWEEGISEIKLNPLSIKWILNFLKT